nr:Gag-Pol polyprotein [Tanacetum cinerariifolium]
MGKTKDLHIADYTQLFDFLKYNQKEVDELKAERLAKTQDRLALMANSNNPYVFPAPHQDQSSFNQNYLQKPMPNPEDIIDSTTAMNMALALMAKAFKLNYSTPTNKNQRISSNPKNRKITQPSINMGQDRQIQMVGGNGGNQFRQYAGQNVGNPAGYNYVIGNQIRNGNLVAARAERNVAGQNGNQIRCYNCRGLDNRTMAQMLQAPIEGYEDAIVVPPINANNFELKQTPINLVQSNQFTRRQDPHNHLCFFNKVTSTFRHPEVPNTTVKLLLFPFLVGRNTIPNPKVEAKSITTRSGYEDAIIVSPINDNNFELKQTLINLVQSNQFTRRQDPHNHLRFFNKVTSTFRHPEVPNTTVKLLLFPFSLEGEA